MNKKRLLLAVLSITLTALISSCQTETSNNKMKTQLTHHVFFWLKNPDSSEDLEKLMQGLNELKNVDVINASHIGIPAGTESRDVVDHSYDVSYLLFFDNTEDQKAYQDHPVHLKFVENHQHLWQKVVVYDAMGN